DRRGSPPVLLGRTLDSWVMRADLVSLVCMPAKVGHRCGEVVRIMRRFAFPGRRTIAPQCLHPASTRSSQVPWIVGSDQAVVGRKGSSGRHEPTDIREEAAVTATPVFDHIALTVPNIDERVDRLHRDFDMVVQMRSEFFAVVVDPNSGLKFELSRSDDDD